MKHALNQTENEALLRYAQEWTSL